MKFNPLVIFANAYDCFPAIHAAEKLPADTLFVNYFPYPENYFVAEEFFEKHEEYSHILYLAPDVVMMERDFEILCKHIQEEKFHVLGPLCNVDTEKYKDRLACTQELPSLEYAKRRYYWLSEGARLALIQNGRKFLQVKFNAGLYLMDRETKMKVKWTKLPYATDERPIWESRGGYACDLAQSHFLNFLDIPIMVDLNIKIKHLRYAGELQVGKKERSINLIKKEDKDDYG